MQELIPTIINTAVLLIAAVMSVVMLLTSYVLVKYGQSRTFSVFGALVAVGIFGLGLTTVLASSKLVIGLYA